MIVRTTIQGLVAAGIIAGAGLAWAEIKIPSFAPMAIAPSAPQAAPNSFAQNTSGGTSESALRIVADAGYVSAPPATAAPVAAPLAPPLVAPVATTVPGTSRDTGYADGSGNRNGGYTAGRDHDGHREGHREGHGSWGALPGSGYTTANNGEKHFGDRHDD